MPRIPPSWLLALVLSAGNDPEQRKRPGTQVILYPPDYKSGDFAYPYSDAQN